MRIGRGMTDAVDAGAQYLPWALGAVSGGFGMAPNKVSEYLFKESDRVSKGITDREKAYQEARKAVSGDVGFDSARLSGNIMSPVNALLGAAVGPMTTVGQQVATGAGLGGIGAMTAPVFGADSTNLGSAKATQAAAGAAAGAVLTPIAAKAADILGKGIGTIEAAARRWSGKSETVPDAVILNSIRSELAREKISLDDIPETILTSVKKQVRDSLESGKKISAAALVRQADFEAVGARGTLGQITRDPVQYTREMNLRGVAGPGDPLMRRFSEQRQQFGDVLSNMGASKADDAYVAGNKIADALESFDAPRKAAVDALYTSARDSSGRSAAMNTAQFSTAANDALDSKMLGTALPTGIREMLNDVSTGKIPLNVNSSVLLRRRLEGAARDLTRQGQTQEALAVRQITSALDATDVESAAGAQALGAFGKARSAAAQRFGSIDKNPALRAVLDGDPNMDLFVSKYVLNGKTDDLTELAKVLNPQGRDTVRQQIASSLEQKAFGSNVTADSAFAVERYNETIKKMGREKLGAFFSADEIDQLFALGRAAAWAGKRPAASAVNESNTAAAAMNLFAQLRGASIALPVVKQFSDTMVVQRGLLAKPPTEALTTFAPSLRGLVQGVPVPAGAAAGGLLSYQ